jgi:adenosylhomocysteinase
MLTWPGEPANMILDDGGDATMLVLRGAQFEKAGVVPPEEDDHSDEYKVFLNLLRDSLEADAHRGDHDRRAAALPVRRRR